MGNIKEMREQLVKLIIDDQKISMKKRILCKRTSKTALTMAMNGDNDEVINLFKLFKYYKIIV